MDDPWGYLILTGDTEILTGDTEILTGDTEISVSPVWIHTGHSK